jgi:hypothetical protein
LIKSCKQKYNSICLFYKNINITLKKINTVPTFIISFNDVLLYSFIFCRLSFIHFHQSTYSCSSELFSLGFPFWSFWSFRSKCCSTLLTNYTKCSPWNTHYVFCLLVRFSLCFIDCEVSWQRFYWSSSILS